jgi:phosphoglycolate phosphatase
MKPKAILFDFDGVLVNTFDFCYEINTICNPQLTPDDYRAKFHGNINECIPSKQTHAATGAPLDFFAHYTPELMKRNVEEDIRELVRDLSTSYSLFIVSSTNTEPIRTFLSQQDLLPCFKEIYGNDTEKSKSKKIQMILDAHHFSPDECVFITDTLGDIREARTCGVSCIAVSWGYHDKQTLAQGNPIAIVDTVKELEERIRNGD